jgi:hypothetical protein
MLRGMSEICQCNEICLNHACDVSLDTAIGLLREFARNSVCRPRYVIVLILNVSISFRELELEL